jgi:membrane-bound lytic murein transglycosylase A
MRTVLLWLLLPLVVVSFASCKSRKKAGPKEYNKQLQPGEVALREVDTKELPPVALTPQSRADIRTAIANSLAYFQHQSSGERWPVAGVTREQVVASLNALDQLVASAPDDASFNQQLHSRFRALMSVGCDDEGTVLFTGYFTPVYPASATQTAQYRYPLYKKPSDLVMPPGGGNPANGPAQQRQGDGTFKPYPDRATIDGSGMLRGQELVWLADPWQVYAIQVQGSAKLRMVDGSLTEIGYDGTNNYPYYPIGKDLVADGKIPKDQLNFFTLRSYFQTHPDDVARYTNRNPRYVFFRKQEKGITGSLGQPVTPDVTIATDKDIFPRGAPCLVRTRVADPAMTNADYVAIRVDQDTGGGIKAPGHADLYMGVGDEAERRAGSQYNEGRLYYLIVRE